MKFIGNLAAAISGKYTKAVSAFIGSGIGLVLGLVLSWVAVKIPGLATCTLDSAGQQVCTIFGYSQTDITVTLTGLCMTWIATHATTSSPANKPT
jgi:hypothetical protein